MDPTDSLKRKTSRWQTLPENSDEPGKEIDIDNGGKYSLLLFLRDLDATQDNWNRFVNTLQNAPGSIDETSTMAAVLAAALETQQVDFDYINPDAPTAKKRRLGLYGNPAAATQLAEYDALIRTARQVWPDPNDLKDVLGRAYHENIRGLTEGDAGKYPVDSIFDFARSWSEVRYRFMNHALRDDPALHHKYNSGRENTKGNNANAIVHESNLLLDARMVEFQLLRGTGYNHQDRGIFEELYLFTPEEGRDLLRYTGATTGLRIGLPQVFGYVVAYIDAYMNWRVRVLESARKQVLTSPAFRNARSFHDKQRLRATANQNSLAALSAPDTGYTALVGHVRSLLDEARSHNAFLRATFDAFSATLQRINMAVRNCSLNTSAPDLARNTKFQNDTAAFPMIRATLTRPTGTSLITVRPRAERP